MKIRTDFVTNSSSASFIAVNIHTDDGSYTVKLESGNVGIIPGKNGGRFDVSEAELKDAKSAKDILQKMCQWLYDTIEDPYCWENVDPSWHDDPDYNGSPKLNWNDSKQVMRYYGSFDNDDLEQIPMEKVKSISIFSRMEFYDEPYGASLTHYDYVMQSFVKQERGADYYYSNEEDPYGEELAEEFNDECRRFK